MPAPTERRRRRRRGAPRWLLDHRGRRFRSAPGAIAFSVHYQPHEGALWRRLTCADGAPLTVPLDVTRAELEATVNQLAGSYSLMPIDREGRQAGDPPEMILMPSRAVTLPVDAPVSSCEPARSIRIAVLAARGPRAQP